MNALLLLVIMADPAARPRVSAAMVINVSGDVMRERADAKPKRLRLMDLIYKDDNLITSAESRATLVFFHDGHQERVKVDSKVIVDKANCKPRTAVESTPARRQRVLLQGLRDLQRTGLGASVVFRGADEKKPHPRISPIHRSVVLEDRPALSWKPVEKAKSYRVTLYISGSNELLWSATTPNASMPYPKSETELRRGRKFYWYVEGFSEDEKSLGKVYGEFFVSAAKETEALKELDVMSQSEQPQDWLVAATVYATYGVDGRALELYERLCNALPDQQALHAAHASYLSRAGRTDEAREAQMIADSLADRESPTD